MKTKREKVTMRKVAEYIRKNWWIICILLYVALTPMNVVFATSAESKWDSIVDFIVPWIVRIGGATAFVGGVIFGAGWKQNDAEAKTNGLNTVIAGCIIAGVAYASDIFFFQ